ncbi:MAG: phosphoadenylyl-sulfate reductase [Deltaproteobacteria bacterium]
MQFTQEQVDELNREYGRRTPQEILRWTLSALHPKVALASSFGAESIIDMMVKINPEARVFTLDTGRLNQETYDVIDRMRAKYGIRVEVMFPDKDEVEQMVNTHGMNLFYKGKPNRILCCDIRKVRPLKRMLATLDGWITGIRREQTENRSDARVFEIDRQHGGILKINPIINWTSGDLWDYIKANRIPYNALHDKGYPSIGCAPCTRPVHQGEDHRAGRWWWESDSNRECGLHADHGNAD